MTKRERMAAYREAARRIADRESMTGCCDALKETTHNGEEALEFMRSSIQPIPFTYYWWPLRDRDSRVLALLLAAEMVRTGDL